MCSLALSQTWCGRSEVLLVPEGKRNRRRARTHIQVVGKDHGGGDIAKGRPLGEFAPFSAEPGHVHSPLLKDFPDGRHFLE